MKEEQDSDQETEAHFGGYGRPYTRPDKYTFSKNFNEDYTVHSHSGSFNMFNQHENSKIADGFGEDSRSVGLSHNESLPEFHNPNDLPQIPYKDQEVVVNEDNLDNF